jgi:hypothetical protein
MHEVDRTRVARRMSGCVDDEDTKRDLHRRASNSPRVRRSSCDARLQMRLVVTYERSDMAHAHSRRLCMCVCCECLSSSLLLRDRSALLTRASSGVEVAMAAAIEDELRTTRMHTDDDGAGVDHANPIANLPLMRLQADPLLHAAHASTHACHSIECLRAHCLYLETTRHTDDIVCTPTSPFSGSPVSTRSGTSPGYANDWADRQERLVRHANEPTKERINKSVMKLMNASVKAEVAEEDKKSERASPCESTPSSVASTTDGSTSCPLSSTHGVTATFAGATPPLHTSDTTASSGPTPSKLLQRRQQRRKDVRQQGATKDDQIGS